MKTKKNPSEKPSGRTFERRSFLAGTAAMTGAGLLSGVGAPVARSAGAAPTIPRRRFGRSDVHISAVGVGGGSRFYLPIPDDESAAELLRRAIDRGIEVVETGSNYGPDGLSEKRIGLAMKTHRSRVFLETKVEARDYDGAMAEMERSLERMRTGYLDLVLHHFLKSSDEIDEVLARSGAERALRQMIDEKVVRFRGFSCHLPAVAMEGMERLEPDGLQIPLNAVRVPDFEPDVLPAAVSAGVAVIAMKTCGKGYFFRPHATKPDRIDQYGPPPEALERWDLPTPKDYIHYALSLPIATAVIGIDSYFTLDGVVSAASEFTGPLPAETMASISERAQVFKTTGFWIPQA
jgi:aryl-alcohol dehydrogenase-like predicted oxidoreductase